MLRINLRIRRGFAIVLCLALSRPVHAFAPSPTVDLSESQTEEAHSPRREKYLGSASQYATDFGSSGRSVQSPREVAGRLLSRDETAATEKGSEFISGYFKGAVLMPVRLWGAVKKPGLHHVPSGTDLMQLITLAGGPNADAEMDEVVIKRIGPNGVNIVHVDLEKLIETEGNGEIELQPNDIVVLPASKSIISANTLTVISVVTSVVGIVASSVLIATQVK